VSDPYLAIEPEEPAEYTAWTEKDRFAIELSPEEYLRKLDVFGARVPDGKSIWEKDTRVDCSLPEYLETLSGYSADLREDARRVWESDPHVTQSFLNYLARYMEVYPLFGSLERVRGVWSKDTETRDDLPTYARRMHTAKVKLSEMEQHLSEWESEGKKSTLIEFVKHRRSSTGINSWF